MSELIEFKSVAVPGRYACPNVAAARARCGSLLGVNLPAMLIYGAFLLLIALPLVVGTGAGGDAGSFRSEITEHSAQSCALNMRWPPAVFSSPSSIRWSWPAPAR